MDNGEPNLDIVYNAATEAGIRLPFTIADLRKWADDRRRVSKGSDRGGEFLPEIDLDLPPVKARATTAPREEVDEIDLPGEPEMWRDILEMEEPEGVKKALGPSAKQAKAAAAEEAARAARAERERTTPPAQLMKEDAAEAMQKVKDQARSIREFSGHIPKLQAEIPKAPSKAQWIKDYSKEIGDEAAELLKRSEARAGSMSDLELKLNAALKRGDMKAAGTVRDQMREAAEAATVDRLMIDKTMRNKLKALAKVPVPKKYAKKEWEDVYQKPPKGFHVAKDRELFDLQGNSPTYRGAWVADNLNDPNNHVTHIQHHARDGTSKAASRKATYKPDYLMAQEQKKWDRIEAFKKFFPTLEKHWRDEFKKLDKPNLTAEEKAYKQHLTVALLAQATGMRRGSDAGLAALKDPKEIRAALMDRAVNAGASPELLKKAEAAADLEEVMEVFDSDEKLKGHKDFKYDLKPNGLPEIKVPTYGATTLRKEDVTFNPDGTADFNFRGKSGVWNNIKLTDPAVVKAIKERHATTKDGEQLFPDVTGDSLKDMMDRTVGEAQGLSRAEAEAAGVLDDDDDDLSGLFKPHDLRRLWANNVAPEIFARIMKEKGRLPEDIDEFTEWVAIAATLAAEELGNEPATFLKNYLSAASFADVIQQMIEAGGAPDPEDYWQFGARLALPEGASPVEARERGRVMADAAAARRQAERAAKERAAKRATAAKKKAAPAKRAAPPRAR